MSEKTIALIGLDTSHTVKFAKLMQHPEHRVVEGMRATKALRFPSAFQPEEGQDQRQAELEGMGVEMAPDILFAVDDVDAVFIEINDPALHLEYYEKVAPLGLPVFIDKPLAASTEDGRRIMALAEEHGTPTWSSSSLRFIPPLIEAKQQIASPLLAQTFGALGQAAAGSDLIWYGVHAVEMLVTALGTGAQSVSALSDESGIVLSVAYDDERRGLVECRRGFYAYGGRMQSKDALAFFDSTGNSPYASLMQALREFVMDGTVPVPLSEAQEVMAILEAGERAVATGEPTAVTP